MPEDYPRPHHYPQDNAGGANPSGFSETRRVREANGKETGGETLEVEGSLEVLPDYGILRTVSLGGRRSVSGYPTPDTSYQLPKDVYVSQSQIRRFDLRMGDTVQGLARPPKEGERYLSLLRVEKVAGVSPEQARSRPHFEDLTPVFPNQWLKLETKPEIVSTRLIDLFCPVGKGQRGLIVSPPYAGKTWLLKEFARGLSANHPEVVLLVALIAERPEEVTDLQRSVQGEVLAATFDEPVEEHTRVAELCLEKAKRLAEVGQDVVILLDSITRLARSYNMVVPPSGRTLSGGFDPVAVYPPKHFFGAARNFEKHQLSVLGSRLSDAGPSGFSQSVSKTDQPKTDEPETANRKPKTDNPVTGSGSLTIIATALVDTGSRMDDLIYEEFKGTGNMELHLNRKLAERRIFPAIDILKSYTRREELLFDKKTYENMIRLRRMVDLLAENEATELILARLLKTKSNQEFLQTLHEQK